MENVDARLHVVAQMMNVVKTHRRIFEFHRQHMRSGLPVREAQHGVRRQPRHEVERAQGFVTPSTFKVNGSPSTPSRASCWIRI